jgi:CheY-like chemotaxis protein
MDDPALSLPGRKKVVVVEDDDEMRDLESFLLGAEGYQVAAVAEGRAALPAVKREGADLVRQHEVERDPATADVPVIVVTAYSKHFRHVQATRQVRRIISKPFDPMDLLNAVDEELRRGPVV